MFDKLNVCLVAAAAAIFVAGSAPAQTAPFAISSGNLHQTFGVAGHVAGTDANGNLQPPSPTVRGGTKSASAPTHEYQTGIDTGGNPTFARPSFADLPDVASPSQLPAATPGALGAVSPDGTTISNRNGSIGVNLGNAWQWSGTQYFGTTVPPLVDLYDNPPAYNWAGLSGGGCRFSFVSMGGHDPGDTDRGCLVIQTTGAAYPPALESAAWLEMDATNGYTPPWAASTAYAANTYVAGSDRKIFINTAACTSGTGPAPAGKYQGLSDGGCTWNWISRGAGNNKVGLIINNRVEAPANGLQGGGSAWGQSNELTFMPGAWPNGGGFATGYEFDSNNNMRDCPPATANACAIYGIFLNGNGNYLSSFGLTVGGTVGFHRGIYVFPGGATDDGIWNAANSSTGIVDSGAHSGDALLLSGSGVNGLNITGTYSSHQINGLNGFNVTASGNLNANNIYSANGNIYAQSTKNLSLGNSTDGTGLVLRDAGGSAANYLNVQPGTSGSDVTISARGSDTNINLDMAPQGTGVIKAQGPLTASGNLTASADAYVLGTNHVGTGLANYITENGANTGFGPAIAAQGSDTNIPIQIAGKGTGGIQLESHITPSGTAPAISSCGATTTAALGSTDIAGGVSIPAGTTSCTVTFATAYGSAPFISLGQIGANAGAYLTARSATGFTVTVTSQASAVEVDWSVN